MPHCQVRSQGSLSGKELFPAAVIFICCIISLAFSDDGRHQSLFWGAIVARDCRIFILFQFCSGEAASGRCPEESFH